MNKELGDYAFVLRFDELPEELLDEKFEEWIEFWKENDPDSLLPNPETDETPKDTAIRLRKEFEMVVKDHFPVYF